MYKNNGKIYTDRIAEALFEDVPSSAGSERAKAEISSALLEEYVRAGESHTEIEALGHIMSRYGSLEAAAALAGYSADDAAAWRSTENALDLSGVKKGFSRARVNIYLMAFFMAETFEYICSFIIFKKPMALAFIAAEAGLAGLFYAKIRRGRRECGLPQGSCLPEARNYLRAMSDRYGKRLINGGALSLCLLVFLLFSAAGTLLSSPMKPEELGQIVFEYSRALSLGIFIMIKNIMCKALADGQLRGGAGAEYKAHLKRLAAASVIYWLAVSLAAAALRSRLDNPLNVIIFASVIYFIAMLAYNLTLRKEIVCTRFGTTMICAATRWRSPTGSWSITGERSFPMSR